MFVRMNEVLQGAGLDDLVIRRMGIAHGLAVSGMESATLQDLRERQLASYSEYEKLVCDSTSGVDIAGEQLEFGDFNVQIPKDF